MRIIVADGEPVVRRAVRDMLEFGGFRVIAEASDGVEATELARYYGPEILLMLSVDLPARDAISVIGELARAAPAVRTILFSADPDPDLEERALLAGASAFVTRQAWGALLRSLEDIAHGETISSRAVIEHLVHRLQTLPRAGDGIRPVRSQLSSREWQVIDLLSAGYASDEVAERLGLSPETIETHLKNAGRKLGVRGREAAIAAAGELIDQALAS